jgi:hypothetical protein
MKRRKIGRKLLLEEKVLVHLLQLLLLGGLWACSIIKKLLGAIPWCYSVLH